MAKILLSGSSGLVGSHLIPVLERAGHRVVPLIRGGRTPSKGESVVWNPETGQIDPQSLEGFDIVIHLAGKNLAEKRWTKSFKDALFQSRCRDTWLLSQALSRLAQPPKVFLIASAVGYYGDRGEETLDENSSRGRGFLSDLCEHWERATDVLEKNGTRVLHTRFGVILAKEGGILKKIMRPFLFGLGAVLGSGKQWLTWVALEDVLRAIPHLIFFSDARGAVNVCAPNPVRNEEFTQVLAHALHRKVYLRIPGMVLKILLGDMATELLLASTKVSPKKLLETGFIFQWPTVSQLFQELQSNKNSG